jgi:hypothetical protein
LGVVTLEEMAKAIDSAAIEEARDIFRNLFSNYVIPQGDYAGTTAKLISSFEKLNRFQAEAQQRLTENFKEKP